MNFLDLIYPEISSLFSWSEQDYSALLLFTQMSGRVTNEWRDGRRSYGKRIVWWSGFWLGLGFKNGSLRFWERERLLWVCFPGHFGFFF